MAINHQRLRLNPFARRGLHALVGALALFTISSPAFAGVCFPTPVTLPGLSGVPIWQGAGVVRTELNEPRWAAAPQTAFDSDGTGNEGFYRIMVDPSNTELTVSFQAPTDPDTPSASDVIYFAFTTDGTGGTLAKSVAIQVNGTGATDPSPATGIFQENFNVATGWSALAGAPAWLHDAAVWRNNVAGDAAWGINFKVNLVAAGLSATAPFKIELALHKADEATPSNSVNLYTPQPGTNAVVPGTLILSDPTQWADAAAINAGCTAGVTISSTQIGTNNVFKGNPAPNLINTKLGAVNQFWATPTIPSSVPLFSGEIQAKFHIANWGSIAASNAPWTVLPGGSAVLNGVAPSMSDGLIEFNCPANTAGKTCDIPTPSEAHQCVYVELKAGPSVTVPFTTAAAYRNMDFQALSDFSAPAEISVKGLRAVFNNDLARDVYVYVYPKNMPPQGRKPIFLATDKMAATRRFSETPPAQVRHVERAPTPPIDLKQKAVIALKPKTVVLKPGAVPSRVASVASTAASNGSVNRPLRELPLPQTGIADLDLNPLQALGAAWPTYDVHVYYDSGKTVTIDGKTSKALVPMFPFTYFHSHEGSLYGFSHSLRLTGGAELKELRPDVYLLRVPSEGAAHVVTEVKAHEKPTEEGAPPPECPKPPPVEINGHCGCRVPGQSRSGDGAPLALFAASALALALARRRRARRG